MVEELDRRIDPEIPAGSFMSATLIHLIDVDRTPRFMGFVQQVIAQVKQAPGILHYNVREVNPTVHLTLTVWTDRESMLAFRDSGSHLQAMQQVQNIADEVFSTHWFGVDIPDWDEVLEKLIAESTARQKARIQSKSG